MIDKLQYLIVRIIHLPLCGTFAFLMYYMMVICYNGYGLEQSDIPTSIFFGGFGTLFIYLLITFECCNWNFSISDKLTSWWVFLGLAIICIVTWPIICIGIVLRLVYDLIWTIPNFILLDLDDYLNPNKENSKFYILISDNPYISPNAF